MSNEELKKYRLRKEKLPKGVEAFKRSSTQEIILAFKLGYVETLYFALLESMNTEFSLAQTAREIVKSPEIYIKMGILHPDYDITHKRFKETMQAIKKALNSDEPIEIKASGKIKSTIK